MVRFKNLLNNEEGTALVMVLSAMILMYIMAAAFTVLVVNETKMIRTQQLKTRAFYIAEAGLQLGTLKRLRHPNKNNADLSISERDYNMPHSGASATPVGRYEVIFRDVDPATDTIYDGDATDTNSEIRKITSIGKVTDTSSGVTQEFISQQSIYTHSPFNRAIWATGNLHFYTSFNLNWCLVTFSLWCANDVWEVTGKIYSRYRPKTDWQRSCPPFNWFDECKKYWLVGWRCCLLLKSCSQGEICCCGFEKDTGNRYKVRKRPTDAFVQCDGYWGDCNSDGYDNEAEGEWGGGASGSAVYFVRDVASNPDWAGYDPLCDDADPQKKWNCQGGDMPFPQFVPPDDPRMPGSSSPLQYMTGPEATQFLKNNQYLQNVWIDGDLIIDTAWWNIFDDWGRRKIGIWGVVYVDGTVIYRNSILSAITLTAYPGWCNYTPHDSAACGSTIPDNMKGVQPGVLIVNKGDLRLWSTGSPDFGRVNIVLVNGQKLTLESFCGLISYGIYYVGGPLVDHDGNPNTPDIRMGGDIYFNANSRFGPLWEPLRILCSGNIIPSEQRHTEFYGATIGNDIYYIGSTRQNDPERNTIDITANVDLIIPEGFWNTIKMWNWREEK